MKVWVFSMAGFLVVAGPGGARAQTQASQASLEGAGAAPVSAAAPAEDAAKDYAQISLEELLNKDVTVAATKTRVDVSKAPVSVTVITPADIARSGATRLGDVLRTVPGLDVLESFPGHVSVSARGTAEVFVNNMLVLIDGRRLEFQVAGVPFFENAPVRLEDIKRIEVVKGPVAAVYGTNALAGIISITTYSPDEVQGTLVSLTGGERDTGRATVRHAGRIGGAWTYKLVGGYTYTGTWSSLDDTNTAPPVGVRKVDGVLVLQRKFADDARLELEGGIAKGDMASLSLNTNQTRLFTWPHLRASYGRPDLHVQLSFSPQDSELRDFTGPVRLTDQSRAAMLSLDRTVRPFRDATITLGGNLRYERSTFTNIRVPHDHVLGGVFAQAEQGLAGDVVKLFGAVGVSTHPQIPTQVDGNAALVVTPVKDHSFRLSAGRGHRDPSFNENFFDFLRRGPRDIYLAPNTDLDPESLRAVEAGYHGRVRIGTRQDVRVFAEAFYEEVKDLISLVNTPVPAGTVTQHPTATLVQQFRNRETRKGRGFEMGADWSVSGFGLLGQYAYQSFEDEATGAEIVQDTPRHKVSAAVRLQRGKLELDVWGHSVSRTTADDGYFLLNPRVGLRQAGWLFSIQAFNALDDRHVEAINGQGLRGETLRRAVSVSVARTFSARP